MVTIISSDMRCWDAPEKADILVKLILCGKVSFQIFSKLSQNVSHAIIKQVSELLGSFGDNELSPECLDGAQRFLKPDGISIPSSYWPFSFLNSYIIQLPCIF